VHKILAMGDLALGVALAVMSILTLILELATFNFVSFIVKVFLAMFGLVLAISSLCMRRSFVLYFGFIQYPFGTGCMLLLLGILGFGTGVAGRVLGSFCIAWGAISIAAHMCLRKSGAAVHTPLWRRYA
jgi:hypothetical protein